MANPVHLPTLLLLAALPGFLHFGGGRRGPEHVPTAADSLPPPWKSASRLSLENRFVQAGLPTLRSTPYGLRVDPTSDRRQLKVAVEPDSGSFRSSVDFGEVPLGVVTRQPLSDWSHEAMRASFQRAWADKSRQSINSLGANTPAARTTGLQFKLPEVLPPRVQSWLGPGGPALNVSGTENIRLSGQSNWASGVNQGVLGQRRSLFPTLDMQQDLDIRLEGQLSDRIKVNLLQNSANQIPLANRIAINYKGDEDDFIQALDLGNTSLALPGTQYVSYSGRNEGLFGAKLATRVGPLDLTMLASRQEGRSERATFQGAASRSSGPIEPINVREYVKGQYFFLYDPNAMLAAGFVADVPGESLRVYLDDDNLSNNFNTLRGAARVDPDGLGFAPIPRDSTFRGNFNLLVQGAEDGYELISNRYFVNGIPVKLIKLRRPLDPLSNQCLAVTYAQRRYSGSSPVSGLERVGGTTLNNTPGDIDSGRVVMKMLRAPRSLLVPLGTGSTQTFDPEAPFNATRELELKNVYYLGGYDIDLTTFKMDIVHGQESPPVTSTPGPPPVPYVEVLGLDNRDETRGGAPAGHDGKVDGTSPTSGATGFLFPETGVLWFYELRPFAPRISGDGQHPFEAAIDGVLNRRAKLVGAAESETEPNPEIYDRYTGQRSDARYFIDVDFVAGRAGATKDVSLGRTNITEGSEAVTVNGERWTRDRDYTIDYDLGRVTLKRQLGPTDQLNIDYAYAPLFAQAGRTLLGSSFTLQGRDRSLGGAFMYESKGAQDLRPRLGEEPSRTLITDLNSEFKFRPSFLTRAADRLPGVRTTMASELEVQAEVGASFPNPNTQNEVYLDDMEGVRDAVSLPMTPERWRWSSVPSRALSVVGGRAVGTQQFTNLPGQWNGEIHWYTPPTVVKEWMLRPNLSEAQGAKNARQALAISMPRTPTGFAPTDTMWAGLTYPLDEVGIDLSRSQFIEVWVNDFRDRHSGIEEPRIRGDGVKLHLDLGVVSEDQMRAPNRPPNSGPPDTEDRIPDRQLSVAEGNDEDTGYDQKLSADEDRAHKADLRTASDTDPEGDDWASPNSDFPDEMDPYRWITTNGVEKNKVINPTPDTEDLNQNGSLDVQENYYEYTIDLQDTSSTYRYLNTDVYARFRDDPRVIADFKPAENNGWRRYRIPITDSLRVQFGSPDLTIARHLRIWLEGVRKPDYDNLAAGQAHKGTPMIMLGGLEIVGSRWQLADLTEAQRDSSGTTATLNSVNTVDNADVYTAPFDPGKTRSGNLELVRREQSLALEFTELQPADTIEAYKTFSLEENYSRYGTLSWYAAGYEIPGYDPAQHDLSYFVRFASDERGQNYYEIKRRVPPSSRPQAIDWRLINANLAHLSRFKLADDFPQKAPILYRTQDGETGDSLIIKGTPSFTRIRRISFGLISGPGAPRFSSGQLWFDEIRARDVAKDMGLADRINVKGNVANLMRYNVSWNSRGADFLSVGEQRGSGSRTDALTVTSGFDVHRFFEGTGIQLPVNVTYSRNVLTPRFNAGDDVVRDAAAARASETRNTTRTIGTNYSRAWSERSNPFLRYTIGGVSASWQRTDSKSLSPTGLDSSVSVAGNVSYTVSPRRLLPLNLPSTKMKFYPLPDRVYWTYNVQTRRGDTYLRPSDNRDTLVLQNQTRGRTSTLDFGADTRPFEALQHHIEGHNDLALENFPTTRFLNFGHLTSWRQTLNSRFVAPANLWVRPTASWNSGFSQLNDARLSDDLRTKSISNNQGATVQFELPFDRLGGNTIGRGGQPNPPVNVAAPRTDSLMGPPTRPRRPPFSWKQALSRLGNVSTETSLNKTSRYDRMRGSPSALYLFGLAENPGQGEPGQARIAPELGNQEMISTEFRTRGQTRIDLVQGSSVQTNAQYADMTGRTNGVSNRRRNWQFPSMQVEYGNVAQMVGLTRFLQAPQLRTSYTRGVEVEYASSNSIETGRSNSNQWQPLLSMSGSLKNGTRVEFSMNLRGSERINTLVGRSRTTDNNSDVNLSVNRNYSQGQKVSFLGRTSTIRSNISLGLTANYSHRTGETLNLAVPGAQAQSRTDERRISMNGTGSYDFSQNVRGTASLGYNQTADKTQKSVRHSVRVEARAQFSF